MGGRSHCRRVKSVTRHGAWIVPAMRAVMAGVGLAGAVAIIVVLISGCTGAEFIIVLPGPETVVVVIISLPGSESVVVIDVVIISLSGPETVVIVVVISLSGSESIIVFIFTRVMFVIGGAGTET